MVALAFNGQGIEVRYGSDGGGLPPGRHKVVIEKSEMVPTKDHAMTKNEYLKLTLRCVEGLAQGGVQEDRLNIHNNSPQAVAIANSQLAAYALVTIQRVVFNQTEELHNIPFYVEVRNQRNNADFTEIAKLFDLNGNEPGKGQQPQVAQAPQAPPQGFGPGPSAPQQQWTPPAAATPAPQQQFAPQPSPEPALQQWQQQQQNAQPPQQAPWAPGGAQPNAPSWGPR
jgi:hypothetical protein